MAPSLGITDPPGENASYATADDQLVAVGTKNNELVVVRTGPHSEGDATTTQLAGIGSATGLALDEFGAWIVATSCMEERDEDVECPSAAVEVFRLQDGGDLLSTHVVEGPGLYAEQIFPFRDDAVVVIGDVISGTRQAWIVGEGREPERLGPDLGVADVCADSDGLLVLDSKPNYETFRNEAFELTRVATSSAQPQRIEVPVPEATFDQQMICGSDGALVLAFEKGQSVAMRIDGTKVQQLDMELGALVPSGPTSQPYFLEFTSNGIGARVLVPDGKGALLEFTPAQIGLASTVDQVEFLLVADSGLVVGARSDDKVEITHVPR